jgi:hypothetical protein
VGLVGMTCMTLPLLRGGIGFPTNADWINTHDSNTR